ncbi:FMN-dependent NADH-azoreductase [Mycoplasmopsis agassizii]|uniref:FMN-dependent NADH-azoreductase n=1 Tax=Mycoplasmopsis agassizii TaxID=33922 RepID=UPI003527C6E2
MAKVLVIKTSMIEEPKSVSSTLNDVFVEEYKKHAPDDEFIYMDLNTIGIATKSLTRDNLFNGFFNPEDSDKYIDQLKSVNKVIMSVPMTNFNVNAVTKNYLDHINVANKTFSYKYAKKGDAVGLLDHLDVQILTTQGAPFGWYPWGNHTEYLRGQFGFFGANTPEGILVAGTKLAENASKTPREMVNEYHSKIAKAAKAFAKIPARRSKFAE